MGNYPAGIPEDFGPRGAGTFLIVAARKSNHLRPLQFTPRTDALQPSQNPTLRAGRSAAEGPTAGSFPFGRALLCDRMLGYAKNPCSARSAGMLRPGAGAQGSRSVFH